MLQPEWSIFLSWFCTLPLSLSLLLSLSLPSLSNNQVSDNDNVILPWELSYQVFSHSGEVGEEDSSNSQNTMSHYMQLLYVFCVPAYLMPLLSRDVLMPSSYYPSRRASGPPVLWHSTPNFISLLLLKACHFFTVNETELQGAIYFSSHGNSAWMSHYSFGPLWWLFDIRSQTLAKEINLILFLLPFYDVGGITLSPSVSKVNPLCSLLSLINQLLSRTHFFSWSLIINHIL